MYVYFLMREMKELKQSKKGEQTHIPDARTMYIHVI